MKNKEDIRKRMLAKRLQLPAKEWEAHNQIIQDRLLAYIEKVNAKSILFFASIKNEVNLLPLAKNYLKNKFVLFPKIANNSTIVPIQVKNIEKDLTPGTYSILEPNGPVHTKKIDMIIVPGLAFSKSKHRIGYGKGYYDIFLKNKKTINVGCFFSFQEENFDHDTHDLSLDTIITEKEIF